MVPAWAAIVGYMLAAAAPASVALNGVPILLFVCWTVVAGILLAAALRRRLAHAGASGKGGRCMDRESPDPPANKRPDAGGTGPPKARIRAGAGHEGQRQLSRRTFLGMLGLGAGTLAVAGAAGLTWRAVDRGVFGTGTGSASAAWDQWNPPGGDVLNLVRAAVLAANAHDTQPWRVRVSSTRIDLFADTARNIGIIDPLRRELALSLGYALENLVLAGPSNGKTQPSRSCRTPPTPPTWRG